MTNKEKLQKAIDLRHDIHMHPDLSNEEGPTYERIKNFLAKNAPSIEVVDKGHYIYAVYHSEHPERPRIAFRCDVDALPIEDLIDEPYKSVYAGKGHKCGHDGHTASMAALCMELDEYGAERDVYMIFQPAEENGSGAAMCTDFITENNIAEIFGMHGSVEEDYGVVQYKDGLMNCASKGMCLEFKGVSTHASLPELGINPTVAMSRLAIAIEEFEKDPGYKDLVMATIVHFRTGNDGDYGIAANEGVLQVTIRGAIEAEMDDLQAKIEAKARELCEEYKLGLKISYSDAFPETVNSPELNKKLVKVCNDLGIKTAIRPEAERGSEDFGHFSKLTKGTIFFMCMGKEKPNMHSVGFNFDDTVIDTVIEIYKGLIKEY